MAHPPETREKVRRLYIQSQLSLQIVSSQCGVSFATAARWKKDAQDSGDDWDKLRAANVLAGNGMEDVGRAILMGLLVQYQTTIEQLNVDSQLPPQARVELLASLSDAFNKRRWRASAFCRKPRSWPRRWRSSRCCPPSSVNTIRSIWKPLSRCWNPLVMRCKNTMADKLIPVNSRVSVMASQVAYVIAPDLRIVEVHLLDGRVEYLEYAMRKTAGAPRPL
jgi:transposase-like protein